MYENSAELIAIIKATEKLEKAYVCDTILPTEYAPECQKKTSMAALPSSGIGWFG